MILSQVVNRINGNVDRFSTNLLYYIGGEHFESNELEITKKGIIKDNLGVLGFKFHFAFQDRDVIFMARNPHLRKAGMVHFSGLCSDASYILRSKDENVLSQEYLAVLLQSDHFWNYCESHKVGSVNFANNWTSIANYEFDLPPIERQRGVASKVWAAYEVKESYKNLLAQTDKLLHAQFEKMFGNLLTNSLNLPTQKMSEVAPEIPSSKEQSGQVWQLNLDMIESKSGKIISKVYIDKDDVSSSTTAFDATNVLYSKLRPNLNKVVVPDESGYCTTELLPLKPNAKLLDRVFLATLLRNEEFVQWAINHSAGTKMPRVSLSAFREFRIIVPPMEKQLEFVRIAEQAEQTKASLNKGIEAIEAVIRSLIAEGTTKV